MVSVGGGDQRDVLVGQRAQTASLALAVTDVDVLVEMEGVGPPGPTGADGSMVRAGHGPPDVDLGNSGDFYIDVDVYDLYGPKNENVSAPVSLPITQVEAQYSTDEADIRVLSDNSDATGVRFSSAGVAEWNLHLDGTALVGSSALTVALRWNVISHAPAQQFGFDWRIVDEDWATAEVRRTPSPGLLLPDDLSDHVVTIDNAWVDEHPYNPPHIDGGATWIAGTAAGEETYNALMDGLGTTPVLMLRGRTGLPYEADLAHVEVIAGSNPWGTPTSLVGPAYVDDAFAVGAGFDPTGAADSRTALQAKMDAASAAGGGTVVVKSGHTLKISSPLYARSNVRLWLQQGARLVRGYAGNPAMLRNESLTVGGKITNFSIVGPGTIGAANTTDGGQIVYLYGDDITLADFTVDTFGDADGGATPLGSQAILIGGDRNIILDVKTANSADIGGTGGIRMYGGRHFRAIGCHIESGDDCLQFVPIASGSLASLDIEDAAYIGCTGTSTEARFMCVTNDNGGAGGMTSSIRNVSFVGCHGSAQRRGILIANTDSSGSIGNVGFVDCSVDMTGGAALGQEIRIERGASAGPVRDIRLNGVKVKNPNDTVLQAVSPTVGQYVENVSLIDCVFDGPSNGAATIAPTAIDGFTVRGGRITSGTGGAGDHVIKGATGANNSKSVRIHGARITDVRDGFAGIRLPETLGFRVRDTTVLPVAGGTTGQGMSLVNMSTGGIIEGNDFSAMPGTKIAGTIATGTIIKDNDGLVTKAKGQGTVAAANTSVNVTHGLGRTPALSGITLTPGNTEAAAANYYVSAVTTSTFTITLSAAPGGAGALFNWTADATIV